MSERILILGGTGLLGKPAARQLRQDGFLVRILARNPERAAEAFDASYEIVPGDVTDSGSIARAMEGCTGVHISVGGPVDLASVQQVTALASRHGIRRISYISGATVTSDNGWFPMVAQKLAAEKEIADSGVQYTIFCPTWPMEQIARFARGGSPFMMGRQPHPVHFLAETDLARMISTAYGKEEAANRRFHVYGPQAMTMTEAILRYCAVFHPGVKKVQVMPVWLARMMGTVTRNDQMKFAADLLGYFNRTPEAGDPAEANRMLGAPLTTLEAWMDSRQDL